MVEVLVPAWNGEMLWRLSIGGRGGQTEQKRFSGVDRGNNGGFSPAGDSAVFYSLTGMTKAPVITSRDRDGL